MTQQETDDLESLYLTAFSNFTDKQVKDAVNKYLQEGEYFPPRPKEIIARIKDVDKDHHTKELIERYTCPLCGEKVSAMSEGLCLDCKGIPKPHYKRDSLPASQESDYKIEGRRQCHECGTVAMCIKEPIEHGNWRCRKCYTGLTKEQVAARFVDLGRMMEDKNYWPKWAEEAPF